MTTESNELRTDSGLTTAAHTANELLAMELRLLKAITAAKQEILLTIEIAAVEAHNKALRLQVEDLEKRLAD